MNADARKRLKSRMQNQSSLERAMRYQNGGKDGPSLTDQTLSLLDDVDRLEAENASLKSKLADMNTYYAELSRTQVETAGLNEKLLAENAALKARVEKLEEVRKAAEEVSYKYSDDYSEDNLRWNELIGALADADALDRAGEK